MKSRCFMLLLGLIAAGTACLTPHATTESSAQQPSVYRTRQVETAKPPQFVTEYSTVNQIATYATSKELDASSKELNTTLQQLKKAKSAEEKSEATAAVEKALNTYFDEDMKSRDKQLEELRKKLDEMEEHLDKRRNSKDEIVELQLRTFVNEANGMGFFGEPATRDFWLPSRSTPMFAPKPPRGGATR